MDSSASCTSRALSSCLWRLLARTVDWLRLMAFGGMFDLGGRLGANRRALDAAWPRVMAFLHDQLG